MDKFSLHFEAAIPLLRQQIKAEFMQKQSQLGFRSAWEHYEDVINDVLSEYLIGPPLSIPERDIKKANSKSVYPDLKIRYEGKDYAIDVKSGEDGRNPWYDMGRLDTYEKSHLEKYATEYYVTVRWKNHETPKVVNVYIEPAHKSVGYKKFYNGVLYRPYDGKVRPKPWTDFDSGYTHWETIDDFKRGLKAAKIHRHIYYIVEWYREMNESQRQKVKEVLAAIDVGKPADLGLDSDTNESTNLNLNDAESGDG
jgi:hypothetical protein